MPSLLGGAAIRDITPEAGLEMWGYSAREGPGTGTLDPLFVKVLVFRCEQKAAALVALDLGRVPPEPICERIRAAARRVGVDDVFLAATHTHHAPVVELPELPYVRWIESAIADAMEEAASRLRPIRIGVGYTHVVVGHNRRRLTEEGRCVMRWRNEEREDMGLVDPDAGVVAIETEGGAPLAFVVHHACRPVVMGPSNRRYSADFPGETARIVKEQTGAECLFLQGACGDINPFLDKTSGDDGGAEVMRQVGAEFANSVLRALPDIRIRPAGSPPVAFGRKHVRVGTRWDFSDPEQREIFMRAHGYFRAMFDSHWDSLNSDLTVPLTVLVLNRDTALVGMPGEIFVRYQLELKERSPVPNALLCGYVDGYHGYFPTVRDALAGGYGGTVASYVGLGAADKLLLEAQMEIGRLTGKSRAKAVPADFGIA